MKRFRILQLFMNIMVNEMYNNVQQNNLNCKQI